MYRYPHSHDKEFHINNVLKHFIRLACGYKKINAISNNQRKLIDQSIRPFTRLEGSVLEISILVKILLTVFTFRYYIYLCFKSHKLH